MQKWIAVVVMLVMALVPAIAVAQNSINSGNASGPGNNNTQNSATGGTATIGGGTNSGFNLNNNAPVYGNPTATGGTGGQGGEGGQGGRGGRGGSSDQSQQQGIFNSGNSRNTNRNSNENTNTNRNQQGQGQLQGQKQGQGQSQGQSAVGIGIGGKGGSAHQSQSQGSTTSGNTQSQGGQANTQTMNQGDQGDIDIPRQAPPAIAPNLVAAPETCMGSAAFGVSSPFGGVSVGSTYKSNDCELRMYARSLMSLGQPEAALALLAQNEKVAAALRATGHKAAWLLQEKDGSPAKVSQGFIPTTPVVATAESTNFGRTASP